MKPKLKDAEREEIFSPSWTRFQRRRRRGGLRRRGCEGLRCQSVEGWWLARGEAKGSAARVAAEKIKVGGY
ncbi:hypothetical protein ES332_A05G237400v1 [Gossypium tomentosum]|uniref:Uncharacterized protein n=1 Tax=Gossypium tomentosum TaxID=34277 RepID=A0A5D2QLT8_GOSTO|nr:hypothetical protein ES332_A05G237400v1 [Gossypium tomentosum]